MARVRIGMHMHMHMHAHVNMHVHMHGAHARFNEAQRGARRFTALRSWSADFGTH
jgi:hypothetical protein